MKSRVQQILLTAVLCGGTFYLGYQSGKTKAPALPSLPVPVTESQDTAPQPEAAPQNNQLFQWGQLESTDYRVYIANLRGIGCPEQTIRDIITADVDSLFAKRRDQLTPSASTRDTLAALSQEENQLLISLLGPEPDKDMKVATNAKAARLLRAKADSVPALPLVLQNVDLTALKMNPSQMDVIEDLRKQFRQEIGSVTDTNDPAYRERWLKAQHESDSLLRGMLGADAYMKYLGLAANPSSQPTQ